MKEKIQVVRQKVFDKTWKKCLVTFLIIFLLILTVGVTSIDYLNYTIVDNNIDVVTVKVTEKIDGDNCFLIITEDNQTFAIEDNDDKRGKKMFNSIKTNESYEFTVRHPDITDTNQFTHILKVQNDTSKNR